MRTTNQIKLGSGQTGMVTEIKQWAYGSDYKIYVLDNGFEFHGKGFEIGDKVLVKPHLMGTTIAVKL